MEGEGCKGRKQKKKKSKGLVDGCQTNGLGVNDGED